MAEETKEMDKEVVGQAQGTDVETVDSVPEVDQTDIQPTNETPETEVVQQDTVESDSTNEDAQVAEVVEEEDLHSRGEWYIVQCFSSHEYKVSSRIQQLIDENKFKDKIHRVLVPEEEVVEIKNNKRLEKVIKIFPGYVFVQMDSDEEAVFYEIRTLPGVSKFIGTKTEPTPVTETDILKVLRKVGDKTKKVDVDFEISEVIKVIGGPFRGYTGPISEINGDKGKLKAMISIFGRETPVELEFDQVEKTVN